MADFLPEGKNQKRFARKALVFSLLVVVVTVSLGWLIFLRLQMDARVNIIRAQERAMSEQKYVLRSELNDLAGTTTTLAYIAGQQLTASDETGLNDSVRRELLNFAKANQSFRQLRVLSTDGTEIANIRRVEEQGRFGSYQDVTPEELGSFSGEPWMQSLINLPAGKVLFAGLFLTSEKNASEAAKYEPVLRIGATLQAVAPSSGVSGYIVVDYPADNLFQRVTRVDQSLGTSTYLVNSEGYWLRGPKGGHDWDALASKRANENFASTQSEFWKEMSRSITGTITAGNGLIIFDTFTLAGSDIGITAPADQQAWKMMTWVDPATMARLENKDASQVWWWVALALGLFIPVTCLIATARDQQREASRLKDQSRALLQSIADTSVDGIIAGEAVRDAQGDIKDFRTVFTNPAADYILKAFDREDSQARAAREFPLFFSMDFFARCVQVVTLGVRFETEQSTESRELGRRWFRIVVVKLDDGVVLTFSDVTQQKFAVNELRQAKESAEIANRTKSQFLTMMGHEIRTPMNGLLGFAALLEKTPLNEEQTEYVSTLRLSGEALLRILDDILDYSHLESEILQIKSVSVDLKELVRQVNQLFVMSLGERNIELVTRVSEDVPDQLLSDDLRLRQILVNLIGNALKFTEEGFIFIKVARQSSSYGDFVVFHVVDSGPGISPDMVDRLFKPFSQVDSTISRRFGGTGLGLSICKRIVEAMGGEIGVKTAPGKGSDFHFSIPVKLPEFATVDTAPVGLQRRLNIDGRQPRVLVVDDDPINRKLIMRMVQKIGAKAELAESGNQAIQIFQEMDFDLILMDMQMPGMDGLETTRKMRSYELEEGRIRRTPISALTANSSDSDRAACFQSGMDDFMSKPIRMEDLERLTERVIA